MREFRRLYVAGPADDFRYCIATSLEEATRLLGMKARVPDSDDIRRFWKRTQIAAMTIEERTAKFGPISRQTLNNWRHKGGMDLMDLRAGRQVRLKRKLKKVVDSAHGHISARVAALKLGTNTEKVREFADELGLRLRRWRVIPDDETLLRIAEGRTWREMAEKLGITVPTLRCHVYKNKALSEAIRKVRRHETSGLRSDKKLDKKTAIRLGQMGLSAYAIAKTLRVETQTITSFFKRVGKETPDVLPPPYGNRRAPGSTVAGSDGGTEHQP